jgi:RNA recognition motif-containing protein
MKRAYLGNLPFTTTEQQLREWLAPYRIKDVQIIHDRNTGRSRGFAFVEFETSAEFEMALHSHNDGTIDGRKIVVNDATEKRR